VEGVAPMKRPTMRSLAIATRLLAVGAVAVAPFLPDGERTSDRRSVVYVVDDSYSLGATGLQRAEELLQEAAERAEEEGVELGVVRVAGDARLSRAVGAPVDEGSPRERAPGTDLEAGLGLALAALPQEGSRRVVILSDGRETRGDARSVATRGLEEDGVPTDVIALGEESPAQTRLTEVQTRESRIAEGETPEMRVGIHGKPNQRVLLEWRRQRGAESTTVRRQWVTLDAEGRAEDTMMDHGAPSGMLAYRAQIVHADQGAYDHTGRIGAVLSQGKPKVLVVTLLGEMPTLLLDAMRRADYEVEHVQLSDESLDPRALEDVDLVVLTDLPLERQGEVSLVSGLSHDAQEALVRYVRELGGGLVVTGGAFGFGPDYAGTPLARALPLAIEDQGEVDDPPVALAVMLDRSGSMGMRVGEHTKMQLAVEAALASAATLRDEDRIAIAAVDVQSHWYQTLGHAAALGANRDHIRSIRAGGGGIFVYTALTDAYRVLGDADEAVRHVILFSDTADSEEQYQGCVYGSFCARQRLPYAVDLARDARDTGITTSVVGIGRAHDHDTTFLQDLAAAGGGRFYLTTRGADLRRIFVTETRAAALSNLREEPMAVAHRDPSPIVRGVGAVPEIAGFVQSGERSTADTALVTPEGHPVLASWRYGLGHVVALTTDAGGRWTESWSSWDGAGQLMRQMARFAIRQQAPSRADARLALDGERVELTVDAAIDAADQTLPSAVELTAYDEHGAPHPMETALERVGPGRYEARGRHAGPTGTGPMGVVARVRDGRGRVVAEALTQQAATGEFAAYGPDRGRLMSLANAGGGRLDPGVEQTLEATADPRPVPEPRWPWALLVAMVLLVTDLWFRRGVRRAPAVALDQLMPRSTLEPKPTAEEAVVVDEAA